MELSDQMYHPSPLMQRAQRLWPDWWNTDVGHEIAELEVRAAAKCPCGHSCVHGPHDAELDHDPEMPGSLGSAP